jgi:hypothetical protein
MIKCFLVLIFSILLQISINAVANDKPGTSTKIDSEGTVFAPALELSNAAGKKILIVGMSHIGYPEFYRLVNDNINNWIAEEHTPALIFREFFTCNGKVLDNETSTNLTQASLNTLANSKIDYNPLNFINADEKQLEPVFKVFKMKKKDCMMDVDGKTMRPPYYVRRNKKWCDLAKVHSGACQWLSFNVPDSDHVKNVEGDLNLDSWPAGMQFVGAVLFQDYSTSTDVDFASEIVRNVFWSPEYVVLDYRNHLLAKKTIDSLATSTSRIILPWGAEHVPGLVKIFKASGFRQTGLRDIPYLKRSQTGKWDLVDSIYDDKDYPISDHYSFED